MKSVQVINICLHNVVTWCWDKVQKPTINLQIYKFFYDTSKFFFIAEMMGGQRNAAYHFFFFFNKIYEENEDKALYKQSARYVDRGQL